MPLISPPLDAMMERAEAAAWLGVSLEKWSFGPRAHIPVFAISRKHARWHPRTIIAALAKQRAKP